MSAGSLCESSVTRGDRTMAIRDEQTIHHIARFNRVATGKTDDAAGATGDWQPASVGLRLGAIGWV